MAFKVIGHTADVKILASGKNRKDLFRNAVLALASLLEGDKKPNAEILEEVEEISVTAPNIDFLLVNFLNEILARSQIKKKTYKNVEFLKLEDTFLLANVRGVRVEHLEKDVKAVTYHNAKIKKKRNGMLEAILVLDI